MNDSTDKISIIITAYNSEKYIDKCISSVCNQTYNNIEIIIVDDGSTDNTFNLCKEYQRRDNRIILISQENQGVSNARNAGLKVQTGKWLMFVDSDDWIEPNTVQQLYSIVQKENADIVQCNSYFSYSEKNEIKRADLQPKYFSIEDKERFQLDIISPKYDEIENNVFTRAIRAVWGKIIKAEIIKERNIKFNEEISIYEDGIFLIELAESIKKVVFVNEYLYHYRCSNNSLTKKYIPNYIEQLYKIFSATERIIEKKEKKELFEKIYYVMQFEMLSSAMTRYFFNKKNTTARKELKEICEKNFKNVIYSDIEKYLNRNQKILKQLLKFKMYLIIQITYMLGINNLKKRKK